MEDDPPITCQAELWRWVPEPPAKGAWHFVTITGAAADAIHALRFERRMLGLKAGSGAVRLRVSVDGVAWETSVFPHKPSGGWMLPVKAEIRKAADVGEGDVVTLGIWA